MKKSLLLAGLALALGLTMIPIDSDIEKIEKIQDKFFSEKGEYLQVRPHDNSADPNVVSAKNVIDDVILNVYETPRGKGYQIVWEDDTAIYHQAYGVEADERTYITIKPIALTASTTP